MKKGKEGKKQCKCVFHAEKKFCSLPPPLSHTFLFISYAVLI